MTGAASEVCLDSLAHDDFPHGNGEHQRKGWQAADATIQHKNGKHIR